MSRLEQQLKQLARERGADLVGLTVRARLADAPPSGDPRYLLPSTESVVAFAVALDSQIARDFIGKRDWTTHCHERKRVAQRLYTVGDKLVEHLRGAGHEALNVDLNQTYRPEPGARDLTEYTDFHPDFSHRYAALAAGLGRLGWSGNLVTPRFGALVELGSVLTSAALVPDAPLPDAQHPCDGCKICGLVCPVEMIHRQDAVAVRVAGVEEQIARKRPNTCCWIGCTGYEGRSTAGTWSNWSPYRLGHALPRDKAELDALCTRLQQADPQLQTGDNSFDDYRRAVFDPDWFYYTVCGFCRSVCQPQREDRLACRRQLVASGAAALAPDGDHVVAGDQVEEVETPYNLRVVIPTEAPPPDAAARPGRWPLDREVLSFLCKKRAP